AAVRAQLPIETGEVDRGRRKLRTESQRSSVFGFGLGAEAAPRVEISQRGTRLRAVSIEALHGDKLGRRALEPFAINTRLACSRNRSKQRGRLDAHTTDWVDQQWRDKRPSLLRRHGPEYVERSHTHQGVGIG